MNKDTFIIGFMLFALFFGAGNLIYPPTLGIDSGTSYWAAISGFVITGVGLPILAVTAISFVKNDARELADRVHPLFGLIFTSVVYLAIGPFFGIPRAATVGYEMSMEPFLDGTSTIALLIFTTVFFFFVFIVSLNPSKMVDRIGQYLTPILLIAIVALSVGGYLLMDNPLSAPTEKYTSSPFFTGFVEGYLTMDAIAALAFGIIVVNAFKERGITTKQDLVKSTLKAGLITGIGLIAVYASIGWIGAKMAAHGTFTNGGEILSNAANLMFGSFGALLLGVIVSLACFTTSVGLVVAAGQFFNKITGISYNWIILIVTIASYIIANQGLNTIISVSVPVLVFIYPIAIVLILLTFMHKLFGGSQGVYRGAILLTAIVSLYDGLVAFEVDLSAITPFMEKLPFFSLGLGWLVPAIVGGLIGLLISRKRVA
ncbi:branched-chain amino acid transport system II carrier protein [Virgibacillus profundi]|uniref:Branched-chain amino acid transport system carrier protein n=1 Tax=Virgibacillus profundi TaxID=2024555 RepID=A0A2A2II12_9BACI|nr:branched-chain amino acid transport system II carrier protein [Virgibacillus profundi]PAV31439.1 branched-chain amino acid transport system II carrier protein [Virgibacillus profundi]PXY55625.1 branched-chain amino acid transport system II carrier protein [Virgibacillus profundi]